MHCQLACGWDALGQAPSSSPITGQPWAKSSLAPRLWMGQTGLTGQGPIRCHGLLPSDPSGPPLLFPSPNQCSGQPKIVIVLNVNSCGTREAPGE